MMEELKRCPFCGAPAQLKEITGAGQLNAQSIVPELEYSMTNRNQ